MPCLNLNPHTNYTTSLTQNGSPLINCISFNHYSQNCHVTSNDVPARVNNENAEIDTTAKKNSGKICG